MPDSVRPRFSAQVMEGPLGCSILFVILVALVMCPLTVASWEEGTEGVSAEREERQWCPLHARGGAWRGSRLQTTDDRRCFSQPSLAVVGHRFQREDQEGCRAMCTRPGLRSNRLPATTSLGRLQDSISVSQVRAGWPEDAERSSSKGGDMERRSTQLVPLGWHRVERGGLPDWGQPDDRDE